MNKKQLVVDTQASRTLIFIRNISRKCGIVLLPLGLILALLDAIWFWTDILTAIGLLLAGLGFILYCVLVPFLPIDIAKVQAAEIIIAKAKEEYELTDLKTGKEIAKEIFWFQKKTT